MKVLITGATGFVGTSLVAALDQHRITAVCPVRRAPARAPSHVSYPSCPDLTGEADWSAALAGCEAVVHLAGRAHIVREQAGDPLGEFRRVNVDATLNLAQQAIAQGVRRFVFVSSVKVHGEQTFLQPFRSSDAPAPLDAYGISKWEAEQGLQALCAGRMELVIVRPPLIYGPGVKANFRQLMAAIARGMPLPLGAVDNQRSLLYVGNLVDFLLTCLVHPRAAQQTWMVSDNEDLSTPALIRLLAEGLRTPARLIPVPPAWLMRMASLAGRRAQMEKLIGSLQVDIGPTLQHLGWRPPYSAQTGLQVTARGWQAEQAALGAIKIHADRQSFRA